MVITLEPVPWVAIKNKLVVIYEPLRTTASAQ